MVSGASTWAARTALAFAFAFAADDDDDDDECRLLGARDDRADRPRRVASGERSADCCEGDGDDADDGAEVVERLESDTGRCMHDTI